MKENPLKYVNGKKIRWQFFTVPLVIHFFIMLLLLIIFLTFSLDNNTFEPLKWLTESLTTVGVTVFFALPWVLLMVLNHHFFGRIVCVLSDKGIHLKDGIIKWEEIKGAEYTIANQSRHRYRAERSSRVTIFTSKGSITILHAPIYILWAMKKHKKDIKIGLSRSSLIMLFIYFVLILFVLFYSIFIKPATNQ